MSNALTDSARLRRMVCAAIFVAFAYISRFFLHFNVMFLTFEIKDAIICIGGLFLGPVYAVVISFLVALIELITISDTGLYGFIMNFLAAAVFSGVAALLYKKWKSLGGAVLSLAIGALAMVAVMMGANLVVTPFFMKQPVSVVVDLIIPLLLPFNVIKALTNGSLVLLLYKPLTLALSCTHLIEKGSTYRINRTSLIISVVAILLLSASILAFVFVLGGRIDV